jgi:hypothetical protein
VRDADLHLGEALAQLLSLRLRDVKQTVAAAVSAALERRLAATAATEASAVASTTATEAAARTAGSTAGHAQHLGAHREEVAAAEAEQGRSVTGMSWLRRTTHNAEKATSMLTTRPPIVARTDWKKPFHTSPPPAMGTASL